MSDNRKISEIRSDDLRYRINEIIKENYASGNFIKRSYAITLAAESEAPRFYTTVETAMRRTNQILKGKKLSIDSKLAIEMYEEIAKRFSAAIKEDPSRYKLDIMHNIINSPAPKFYITNKTAHIIAYLYNKK